MCAYTHLKTRQLANGTWVACTCTGHKIQEGNIRQTPHRHVPAATQHAASRHMCSTDSSKVAVTYPGKIHQQQLSCDGPSTRLNSWTAHTHTNTVYAKCGLGFLNASAHIHTCSHTQTHTPITPHTSSGATQYIVLYNRGNPAKRQNLQALPPPLCPWNVCNTSHQHRHMTVTVFTAQAPAAVRTQCDSCNQLSTPAGLLCAAPAAAVAGQLLLPLRSNSSSTHTTANSCRAATACSATCTSAGTLGLPSTSRTRPCRKAFLFDRSRRYEVYSSVPPAMSCSAYIML